MNSDDRLPLSAFMPNHFSSDPHAPFIATAGKKNDSPVRLIDKNDLKIKMSLTAPGCPVAGEMPGQVANTLAKIPNIGLIEVELVWEPAWTKDRMSEDAKLALDIY